MKYSTIQIKPEGGEWTVSITRDERERVRKPGRPNPMGFFHFPATMTDQKAFNKLRDCLVKSHKDEIKALRVSLDKLQSLTFESDT